MDDLSKDRFKVQKRNTSEYPRPTVALWPARGGGVMLVTVTDEYGRITEYEVGEAHDEYGGLWEAVEQIVREEEEKWT